MSERPKEATLIQYLVATVGVMRAAKVGGYIVWWGFYSDDLQKKSPDSRPTFEGLAAFSNRSIRSVYREQALFRKAFPTQESPELIWRAIRDVVDKKSRQRATGDALAVSMDWAL